MPIRPSDLLGFGRLAVDATLGLSSVVEALHGNIARAPGVFDTPSRGPAGGIPGLVFESIRSVAGITGVGVDSILGPLTPSQPESASPPSREAVLAALNGIIGDHLAATDNPLAISMRLRRNGKALTLERQALSVAIPRAGNKLVVLVHGLCRNDLQWKRKRHNHGTSLARDLAYTPVWLHYNSGLHISTNGLAFAKLLEDLVGQWPARCDELVIVAHSMGGLVSRSAHHYAAAAGYRWPRQLRKIVFLGTPHHGAPLERLGNLVTQGLRLSPYTDALARLGELRSAGITDLRYGNLLEDDWQGRGGGDLPRAVPLPRRVACYAIAALASELLGDGVVPLNSALGRHQDPARNLLFPESRQFIVRGIDHFDLLSDPSVYRQIRQWLDA